MKKIKMSFITAFSIYSKVPMPVLEWNKEDMDYTLCAFPFVGVVILGFQALAYFLFSEVLRFFPWFSADIILALVPILVTGGIHVDGFMDTCDARKSYGDREKKLEILSDPHIGAFSVISLVVYVGLYLAGVLALNFMGIKKAYLFYGLLFVFGRIVSAYCSLSMEGAKKDGMLQNVKSEKTKKRAIGIVVTEGVFCVAAMALLHWEMALAVVVVTALFVWYFKHMCKKEFGGITGDLAGYLLCMVELLGLLTMVVVGNIL